MTKQNPVAVLKHLRPHLIVLALLFSGSANAELVRYDVHFSGEDLGHMIFDADIGSGDLNLWSSLVDWHLSWFGAEFNKANSSAVDGALFVVNAAGTVIHDGVEDLIIRCVGPVCSAEIIPSNYPLFSGLDGISSLGFHTSDFVEGVLYVDYGDVGTLDFGSVSYSGPTAIPLPATAWLVGSALFGLRAANRGKTTTRLS